MPQGQMYVNVYIPDWNSLNDYQKSFMNFFVKDAAFIVHTGGTSSSPDSSTLYGEVCNICKPMINDGIQFLLTIPYSTISTVPQSITLSYYDSKLQDNYQLSYLESVNSKLLVCDGYGDVLFSFPGIQLRPYINGSINTDHSIVPVMNDFARITNMSHLSVDNLEYRFQLRTSNFRFKLYGDSDSYDCYYKIGVCSFSQTTSSGDLIDLIKSDHEDYVQDIFSTSTLKISHEISCDSVDYVSYKLTDYGNYYSYATVAGANLNNRVKTVLSRVMVPVELSQDNYAIVYLELYDANNNEPMIIDSTATITDILISSDNVSYISVINDGTRLEITDSHLNDSEFIPTYSAQI